MKTKNILVVAAHPDDEVLGCGGTIARHAKEGHNCYICIMGEGITSRGDFRNPKKCKSELDEVERQAVRAGELLKAQSVELYRFPDNRMDSVDFLDVVKVVEKATQKFEPHVIYTHHGGDLNIDHRITARAVETATRPVKGHLVPELYSFETPSSTEWAFANKHDQFHPNYFVDIEQTIHQKVDALSVYRTETKVFPHPRSREAIENLAKVRGAQVGLVAAEAFCLIRKIS